MQRTMLSKSMCAPKPLTKLELTPRIGTRPEPGTFFDSCGKHSSLLQQIKKDLRRWVPTPINEAVMRHYIDSDIADLALTLAVHNGRAYVVRETRGGTEPWTKLRQAPAHFIREYYIYLHEVHLEYVYARHDSYSASIETRTETGLLHFSGCFRRASTRTPCMACELLTGEDGWPAARCKGMHADLCGHAFCRCSSWKR